MGNIIQNSQAFSYKLQDGGDFLFLCEPDSKKASNFMQNFPWINSDIETMESESSSEMPHPDPHQAFVRQFLHQKQKQEEKRQKKGALYQKYLAKREEITKKFQTEKATTKSFRNQELSRVDKQFEKSFKELKSRNQNQNEQGQRKIHVENYMSQQTLVEKFLMEKMVIKMQANDKIKILKEQYRKNLIENTRQAERRYHEIEDELGEVYAIGQDPEIMQEERFQEGSPIQRLTQQGTSRVRARSASPRGI